MSVQRARAMRKAMTPPELALWLRLRGLKSEGWHFRRQAPEPPYILDFVCRTAKLVVEVDGVHHSQAAQLAHDEERDGVLRERGFRVLRFWASDVTNELDGVMEAIVAALGEPKNKPREASVGLRGGRRHQHLVRLGLRPRKAD